MYTDIKKIYKNTRLDMFIMASSHLMWIGWETAQKMTDEQISEVKGNGLMTTEFCQELCKIARDIANSCSPTEFVQLAQIVELYSIEGLEEEI
jgi:hypothetical protein